MDKTRASTLEYGVLTAPTLLAFASSNLLAGAVL